MKGLAKARPAKAIDVPAGENKRNKPSKAVVTVNQAWYARCQTEGGGSVSGLAQAWFMDLVQQAVRTGHD
jgi:hypothetical protein